MGGIRRSCSKSTLSSWLHFPSPVAACPEPAGQARDSNSHPGLSPTHACQSLEDRAEGHRVPEHLGRLPTALRATARPLRPLSHHPISTQPGATLQLLPPQSRRYPQACPDTFGWDTGSLQGWAGTPSPLSRDVVIVLETRKLPLRGLDRIQTGASASCSFPNQGVCREQ